MPPKASHWSARLPKYVMLPHESTQYLSTKAWSRELEPSAWKKDHLELNLDRLQELARWANSKSAWWFYHPLSLAQSWCHGAMSREVVVKQPSLVRVHKLVLSWRDGAPLHRSAGLDVRSEHHWMNFHFPAFRALRKAKTQLQPIAIAPWNRKISLCHVGCDARGKFKATMMDMIDQNKAVHVY